MGYRNLLPVPKSLLGHILSSNGVHGAEDVDRRLPWAGSVSASATPRTSIDFEAEPEPDVRVWSKRKAVQMFMNEAEEILRAWSEESAFVSLVHVGKSDAENISASASADTEIGFAGMVDAGNGGSLMSS